MVSSTALLVAVAAAVSASSPPGFSPAVKGDLLVDFNNTLINGQVVPRNLVLQQPTLIGTTQRMTGNSFTVIMIDLDIPTGNNGQTSTLLHWMQTGLVLSPQASRVSGRVTVDTAADPSAASAGSSSSNAVQVAFLLRNTTGQAPAAPYIAPNPPARLPLSHTYAQFLVDTSDLSAQSTAMQTLMTAAQTRQGFNLGQVLQQAGLTNRLVAANFFNVTNPGPVQTNTGNGNNSTNGNGQQQQQGGASSSTGDNSASSGSAGSTGSTGSTGSSSGSSSSGSSSSSTSTIYGNNGNSGSIGDSSSDSSSASTANGNNVVKASGASSLSIVSGSVAVLAGAVALLLAL